MSSSRGLGAHDEIDASSFSARGDSMRTPVSSRLVVDVGCTGSLGSVRIDCRGMRATKDRVCRRPVCEDSCEESDHLQSRHPGLKGITPRHNARSDTRERDVSPECQRSDGAESDPDETHPHSWEVRSCESQHAARDDADSCEQTRGPRGMSECRSDPIHDVWSEASVNDSSREEEDRGSRASDKGSRVSADSMQSNLPGEDGSSDEEPRVRESQGYCNRDGVCNQTEACEMYGPDDTNLEFEEGRPTAREFDTDRAHLQDQGSISDASNEGKPAQEQRKNKNTQTEVWRNSMCPVHSGNSSLDRASGKLRCRQRTRPSSRGSAWAVEIDICASLDQGRSTGTGRDAGENQRSKSSAQEEPSHQNRRRSKSGIYGSWQSQRSEDGTSNSEDPDLMQSKRNSNSANHDSERQGQNTCYERRLSSADEESHCEGHKHIQSLCSNRATFANKTLLPAVDDLINQEQGHGQRRRFSNRDWSATCDDLRSVDGDVYKEDRGHITRAYRGAAESSDGAQREDRLQRRSRITDRDPQQGDMRVHRRSDAVEGPSGSARRTAISAEAFGTWNERDEVEVFPKRRTTRIWLTEAVRSALAAFLPSELDHEAFDKIVDACKPLQTTTDQILIRQGAEVADDEPGLFVLEHGELWAFQHRAGDDFPGKTVKKYKEKGVSFGEFGTLYNAPRAASVISISPCALWCVDRRTVILARHESATRRRNQLDHFLAGVEVLQTLGRVERAQMIDALQQQMFSTGAEILRQGDVGSTFFLLVEGQAAAFLNGQEVMRYGPGSYFGELALLRQQTRAASVRALTECTCATLDRDSFIRILGPLETIRKRAQSAYAIM